MNDENTLVYVILKTNYICKNQKSETTNCHRFPSYFSVSKTLMSNEAPHHLFEVMWSGFLDNRW